RWEESRRHLMKASELKIEPEMVREPLHVARLAVGEAQDLVREYRERIAGVPHDIRTLLLLSDALVAAGQPDQVEAEVDNWSKRKPVDMPPQTVPLVRAAALYTAGKLAECELVCKQTDQLRPSLLHAQAMIALGRAKEAAADRAFENAFDDPWGLLA